MKDVWITATNRSCMGKSTAAPALKSTEQEHEKTEEAGPAPKEDEAASEDFKVTK
jgi:hypothetical protein